MRDIHGYHLSNMIISLEIKVRSRKGNTFLQLDAASSQVWSTQQRYPFNESVNLLYGLTPVNSDESNGRGVDLLRNIKNIFKFAPK